jgi:hypothetical protein
VLIRALAPDIDLDTKGPARTLFLEEHKIVAFGFTITLIGGKSFRLEREGGPKLEFYDAAAFFTSGEARQTLDQAALSMLGEQKQGPRGLSGKELDKYRKSIGTVPGFYEANRADIIEYCKRDAWLTKRLGELLIKNTGDALGFWPSRWSSAASLAKAWLGKNHPEIGARTKTDLRIFRRSFRGGIFVTRIVGRVESVDELDLTQAYASALCNMPSLEGLEKKIGTTRSPDAVFGCYLVLVGFDGRLGFRVSDLTQTPSGSEVERMKFPIGEPVFYPDSEGELKPYWAELTELRFWDEVGKPYVVVTSYEFCGVPKKMAFPDLVILTEKVRALKEKAKHDPATQTIRETFKRVVNSLYGTLAESRHGETPFTTWPMAARITAECRVKIWREWRKVEEGKGFVVSVNTDSLRYVPNEYHIPTSPAVGDFAVKFENAITTHYQSGVAMIQHLVSCRCGECDHWNRIFIHDNGSVETHTSTCGCDRCKDAPRVYLRKRGMPTLTPEILSAARGYELEVVNKRPLTINEGVIQHRMEDVANIPDTEDDIEEDDGVRRRSLSLLANLKTAVYDSSEMNFPTLNKRPVMGKPMPYEALFEDRWVREALAARKVIEARAVTPMPGFGT